MLSNNWSNGQIALFVKDVRKRVGNAWLWITPDIQKALIAEKVLSVICGQDRPTVEIAAVQELFTRMLAEAKLDW